MKGYRFLVILLLSLASFALFSSLSHPIELGPVEIGMISSGTVMNNSFTYMGHYKKLALVDVNDPKNYLLKAREDTMRVKFQYTCST